MLGAPFRRLNRREPPSLPVANIHRCDATLTQAEVSSLFVGRSAPNNLSTEFLGVVHQRRAPHLGAALVGIESPHVSALLARDQQSVPVGKVAQNGRRAEVLIRSEIL